MNRPLSLALAALLAIGLAGCSWFTGKEDYKGAASRAVKPLEVPPDLSTPGIDDRYAIPDPKAQTTYSAYSQRGVPGAAPAPGSAGAQVLPPVEGARIERQGDQRWLVVKGEPAAVWPLVRQFWIDSGFTLAREEPNAGILETDWLDDKSKIPQDIVRNTLGKVVPNLWQSARRDKYRTRLEKGSDLGTTEVFVSNRQVEEVWADSTQTRTAWQNKPADREAEAEMLQKMMVRMGSEQARAAAQATTTVASKGSAPAAPDSKNAVMKGSELVVNDTFERTWRRVGLALDRVGFTVEDRDRSKGLFFVRYIDPERDASSGKKEESWTDKLKFWKPAAKDQPQYRIHVSDAGSSTSQVQVQDSQGVADQTGTGKKIITLLYDQLK
jgi:outer membrane protein assembly factor BamC